MITVERTEARSRQRGDPVDEIRGLARKNPYSKVKVGHHLLIGKRWAKRGSRSETGERVPRGREGRKPR